MMFVVIVVIVSVVACVAASKIAYQKGFNDGMAYRRKMDVVSWREAIDCLEDSD